MKPRLRLPLAISILLLLAIPALAQMPQPFSADMSTTSSNGNANMKGKFFFSPPKIRMDMASLPGQHQNAGPFGGNVSMIVDGDAKITYMLMNDPHMYMEFPANSNSPMMQRMPKPEDYKGGDPCTGNHEGATCKKLGTETINGRVCDKWEVTSKTGEKDTFWVDQKLHFPIKTVSSSGMTTEFTNIKEGAQDASLFKVPAGYRKFDAGMMGGQRPH